MAFVVLETPVVQIDIWMVSIEGIAEVLGVIEIAKGEILGSKMC